MARLVKINRSEIYPDIILDKENGIFEIRGVSLPENGKEFYRPVLDFLDEYCQDPNKLTQFVFNLRFFNISSSKMILYILYKLKELQDKGHTVVVIWCYDHEDIREAGEDFAHMVPLPFQFKEVFMPSMSL